MRPIPGAKLTDTFGAARSGGRKHEGIDIFAPEGTPIHAVAGGTIVQGFTNGLGGNVVRIQGDDGRFYYYAHLTPGSTDHLQVGQHVAAGEVIGGVGHTGDAAGTPNHLHFQVRQNGQWINPFNFLTPLPDIGGAPGAAFRPGRDRSVRDRPRRAAVGDRRRRGRPDRPVRAAVRHRHDQGRHRRRRPVRRLRDVGQPHGPAVDRHQPRRHHRRRRDRARPGPRARPDPGRGPRRRFRRTRDLDSDNDGVSDLQEQKAGTNPLDADTDHDGLSDGVEAAHGSNALSIDSDHDGLTDGFESAAGTLEPVPQTGVPGGAALDPGGMGPRAAWAQAASGPTLWPQAPTRWPRARPVGPASPTWPTEGRHGGHAEPLADLHAAAAGRIQPGQGSADDRHRAGRVGPQPGRDRRRRAGDRTWGPSVGLFQIRTLKAETGTGSDRDIQRLLNNPAEQVKAALNISNERQQPPPVEHLHQRRVPQVPRRAAAGGRAGPVDLRARRRAYGAGA